MASDAILEITDANFDQTVLKSDQPVMVDFGQHGVARARHWRRLWMK